ncbi:MAG TPA: FAD:protein FMN transferase [Steroidobacteraceae bacterium]|nr:FAD:protein FMN transferase [Steroidobacteraceae bacterium]
MQFRPSIALALLACLAGCASAPPESHETLLTGETMGSAWTVKIAGALPLSAQQLQAGVQARFETVNQALSTYRADSALSRFNDDDRGEWLDVDPELAAVLVYALSLAEASGGAYDVTVGPLVNLWGFGPDPATQRVPDAAAIAKAKARVGWRKVEVDEARSRARKQPGVRVDLSSLGKGRGVDRVAEYLDSQGVSNYLIDLSGKLRAHGHNSAGGAWLVAIERPIADATSDPSVAEPEVVSLRGSSVATAGDYRRFFEVDGRHYSHIIDPRTGEPVTHRTVSATVLEVTCMHADAWATVLMVMQPQAALALADARHLKAMLIAREPPGYRLQPSAAWRAAPPL